MDYFLAETLISTTRNKSPFVLLLIKTINTMKKR